jgi:putative protease
VILNELVIPNNFKQIPSGTIIYRNSDAEFNRLVEREDSAIRKISISLEFKEITDGFQLIATDEDGHSAEAILTEKKELAKNNDSVESIKKNLSKTGNTPFVADEITIHFSENWFLQNSKINEIRRLVLEKLIDTRIENYHREEYKLIKTNHPYPVPSLDYTFNVSNKLARKFYERHGVTSIEKALENQR